ncbi:MAG: amidohydrolase [Oscillospiraceae bacterium]|nr:amidohydrolase [Oscillospiraceae bacterium]
MDCTKSIFAGKPVDFEVIDVHVHYGDAGTYQLCGSEAEGIVHTMGRLGMDLCCCCGNSAASDWYYINENVAKGMDRYPDKLKGYVVVNPFYEDLDPAFWFERSPGFIGLKVLACVQGDLPLDHPRYHRFYEYADRHNLPVLVHTWIAREVNEMFRMAQKYPNARFICAHSALTNRPAKEALIEGMKICDNVVADTAISEIYDGALEWIADKIGTDRLVYGSDFITFECSHILGRVAMSKLTDDDKEKIFSRNAKQWLKL